MCLHKLRWHFQAATSGKLILVLTELWILPIHQLIQLWSFEVLIEVPRIFWSEGEGEGEGVDLSILWKLVVTLLPRPRESTSPLSFKLASVLASVAYTSIWHRKLNNSMKPPKSILILNRTMLNQQYSEDFMTWAFVLFGNIRILWIIFGMTSLLCAALTYWWYRLYL